ncbi:dihydroorotase [Patescibacteria group bacterium]|nr:dihydroorotase [Patescibacteria group bacterium]
MNNYLLKNGEIVLPGGEVVRRDLFLKDGKIGFSGEDDAEIIDCEGKIILPGIIDAHVHFRDPGHTNKEDFESGSRAAVVGGITTVLDMPNNEPAIVDQALLEMKRRLVVGRAYCNYGFYIGFNGKNFDEVEGSSAVAVKVYVANSTGDMGVSNESLEELFKQTSKLVVVHAEDEGIIEKNREKFKGETDPSVHSKIRSVEAEVKALKFVCELAKKYEKRLHIAHLSSADGLKLVQNYRKWVTCEVAPHHLFLTVDDYGVLKNRLKVNPPVRGHEDAFALWLGIKHQKIDMVATDHAPHTLEEKDLGYIYVPAGVPEVETLLPMFLNMVNDDGMSFGDLVRVLCEKPAEIFGLKGKGRIEEGMDGDVVVVDMELERKVGELGYLSKCGWSPYHGSLFKGWPVKVFVGGELVADDGKVVGEARGREIIF